MLSLPSHGTRRPGVAATATAMVAALAVLPTASAVAGAPPSSPASGGSAASVRPSTTRSELLTTGQLNEELARLPLNSVGAAQLAHYLAGVEGIGALAGLQGLLGGELGGVGLEKALTEAIERLQVSNPSATLGELTNAATVVPALEGKLQGLLKLLTAPLGTSQKEAVEQALGSLSLDQLVNSLLSEAKPGEQLATELANLAGNLFKEVGNTELKSLTGSTVAGAFAAKTVQEVASAVGTTPKAIGEQLGQAQLSEAATMLTAPLARGKLLGVAPALNGLVLGALGGEGGGSGTGGGSGGSGGGSGGSGTGGGSGAGGSGGGSGSSGTSTGGSSGQGSSGSGAGGQGGAAGAVSLSVTLPGAPAATKTASTATQSAKVRVLGHTVKGQTATVVLYVPAAGRVVLSGHGVRTTGDTARRAGRLTVRVHLSRAGTAALRRSDRHGRRRHRGMTLRLTVSFVPAAGPRSTATTTVHFA